MSDDQIKAIVLIPILIVGVCLVVKTVYADYKKNKLWEEVLKERKKGNITHNELMKIYFNHFSVDTF